MPHGGRAVPTSVYFPLRSNARQMVRGSAGRRLARRIRMAALLTDRVILEDGAWLILGGNRGFVVRLTGPQPTNGEVLVRDWQSTHDRASIHRSGMSMYDNPGLLGDPVVSSGPGGFAWYASFAPILAGLPAKQDVIWTSDGPVEVRPDAAGSTTGLLTWNVAEDLKRAAELDAWLAIDPYHGGLLQNFLRPERPEVAGRYAGVALEIAVPDISYLTWEDILALRQHRGMPRLRAVLEEIEAEVAGEHGRNVEAVIASRLIGRLAADASETATKAFGAAGTHIASSVALSLVPVVGGLLSAGEGAALEVRQALAKANGWSATLLDLRDRASRRREEALSSLAAD